MAETWASHDNNNGTCFQEEQTLHRQTNKVSIIIDVNAYYALVICQDSTKYISFHLNREALWNIQCDRAFIA